MIQKIPVSEARKRLPKLLKRLGKHPTDRIRITVHGVVAGELRAPEPERPAINIGAALLEAARKVGPRTEEYPAGKIVSVEHDEFIYKR